MNLADKLSWGLNGFLIGLGCVFLVLLLLIVLISIMGKLVQDADNKAKKESVAPAKSVDAAPQNDEDEIIAVIAAAVACMAQREGKKFKIRSFKRV